jgi:phosphoribosyl-AMP cyclohydrolase
LVWIFTPICGYRATEPRPQGDDDEHHHARTRKRQHVHAALRWAGLLTAICQHAQSREILMVAFMDAEALAKTRETGLAHFHSRSRGKLWLKGETSGHFLRAEMRVDCDQDALVLLCHPEGPACHTGAPSCFYRRLEGDC